MSITRRVAVGGLAALPFVQAKAQAQQTFPSKPFTLVVPFPAGGPADIFGRNLAERMSPLLGQPVLVENKSGAAGVTGIDFVAKAGSDAHVMGLMSASAGAIMQSLMPKMPFDPAKDIAPRCWWCACRRCSRSTASSASPTSRASSPRPRPSPAR